MDLSDLLDNYTLRTVALGCGVLGVVSGALGTFAVLRRQSLLGDAISHAALPGIALAYFFTHSKAPLVLAVGAALAGWLATLLVMTVVRSTRIPYDTALGLVLSVFFGFGLMLLTFLQKRPDSGQAGLDRFLFGQAATLLAGDVLTMAALGAAALFVLAVFWKEFKLLAFDPEFAATLGWPVRAYDVLLTSLLVVAIVIGLQAMGVVLMSAMIVAPASAARQWTDRLGLMAALAALFGAAAGVSGGVVSSLAQGLPTGPTVVLCLSAVVVFSLLLAPNRGLVWERVRHWRGRRRLRVEAVLADLLALEAQHAEPGHGHSSAVLQAMRSGPGVRGSLEELERRGLVRSAGADAWALTPDGREEAERLERERHEETN